MKISSRAKALLSFLSQFSEPFDLKDALNCPADFEMGHPSTWNDSTDQWGIFRELFHANLIELSHTQSILVTNNTQVGNITTVTRRYLYGVTAKGQEALLPKPFASKFLKMLFHSAQVDTSKTPILARVSNNQKFFIK